MSRRGTSPSLLQPSPCIHPRAPLHPTTLSHTTAAHRSACASSHTCVAGAVCHGPSHHYLASLCRPGIHRHLRPTVRSSDRLPNTIKHKAQTHAASSTSQHEPRATAASQELKIVKSCPSSSRHARDLIGLKIPADEREKEACHGAAQAPPSLINRLAHSRAPLHPTTLRLSHTTRRRPCGPSQCFRPAVPRDAESKACIASLKPSAISQAHTLR